MSPLSIVEKKNWFWVALILLTIHRLFITSLIVWEMSDFWPLGLIVFDPWIGLPWMFLPDIYLPKTYIAVSTVVDLSIIGFLWRWAFKNS